MVNLTSRRSFARLAAILSLSLVASPRLSFAEATGVAAYGTRIDLATGALTARPGIKNRPLKPTGPIVVGSSRFQSVEQRGQGGGTITIEERNATTGALRRSWRAAQHPQFYDTALVELHAEPGVILVDVHFLTFM